METRSLMPSCGRSWSRPRDGLVSVSTSGGSRATKRVATTGQPTTRKALSRQSGWTAGGTRQCPPQEVLSPHRDWKCWHNLPGSWKPFESSPTSSFQFSASISTAMRLRPELVPIEGASTSSIQARHSSERRPYVPRAVERKFSCAAGREALPGDTWLLIRSRGCAGPTLRASRLACLCCWQPSTLLRHTGLGGRGTTFTASGIGCKMSGGLPVLTVCPSAIGLIGPGRREPRPHSSRRKEGASPLPACHK